MLNIVLVEPEIPQNTGNIARTCAAIGARLHIIKPIMFEISDATVKRAGLDYWPYLDFVIHESLGEFLGKHGKEQLFFVETAVPKLYTDVIYPETAFLVFGQETNGLPKHLLTGNIGTAVTIPMLEQVRSLNLSNAVAIVAYEALRQRGFTSLPGYDVKQS